MLNTQPGWYPDPSGSHQNRYWDGAQWTERAAAPSDGGVPTFTAPEGTHPTTPWIWVLALFPILTNAITVAFTLTGADRVSLSGNIPTHSPGYYVELIVQLPIYVFGIVLAYLDSRELMRRGVPYPFSWGWAFFGIVYVIGRSVVVHRRTGRGFAPLWVYLAVVVVTGGIGLAVSVHATLGELSLN